MANRNELSKEESEVWEKIYKFDPMLFSKGYSKEELNKKLDEILNIGVIDNNDNIWRR